MHLSTHYYVLSLGADTNTLFEAFRDFLISVENQGFPINAPASTSFTGNAVDWNQLKELARTVDSSFDHYYIHEPLNVVVVGDGDMQSAFSSVTVHGPAIIGCIDGDHSSTSPRELGEIVWPVVREAMSGALEGAMRDLEESAGTGLIVTGLERVARRVNEGVRATLLVEKDYRLKGRVGGADESPVISTDVDIRETIDDAIDGVIERVLESGGHVIFAPPGSLSDWNRIVLLLHRAEEV